MRWLTPLAKLPAPVRIVVFLLLLLLTWAPIALPISALVADANLRSILTMPILYLEFLLWIPLWNRALYGEAQPLRRYGLRFPASGRNLLAGLCVGWGAVLLLFMLQGELGWMQWLPPQDLGRIVREALLMSIPLGFAEELLFRGWLLDELERDYGAKTGAIASSVVFAIAHFLRPLSELIAAWLTFPALVILGLALVWAKRAVRGHIALSIGLHAGLVGGYYVLNVGNLIQPVATVPTWITGMNGNPLASVPGVLTLGCIAGLMRSLRPKSNA